MLEFYTTLEFNPATASNPRSITFRLLDVEYTLHNEALQRTLGVIGGRWNLLEDYTDDTAWAELRTVSPFGGQNDHYYQGRYAKTASLTRASYQRFQTFVCANYGGLFELNRFSSSNLEVLHRVHHGERVDLASYIFSTLPSFCTRPTLTWGAFITVLARRLSGLNELPVARLRDAFPPVEFTRRQFSVTVYPVQDPAANPVPKPAPTPSPAEEDEPQAQPPPYQYGAGFDAILARLDTMQHRMEQMHLASLDQDNYTHDRLTRLEGRLDFVYQQNGWALPPDSDDDNYSD